jgi:hypothetical protein
MTRLRELREQARDVIENKEFNTRRSATAKRTQKEEEVLNDRIRLLQKENPHIDYTQLFDTKRAEDARSQLHKKTFASYKAFQFLKHGISVKEDKAKGQVVKKEKFADSSFEAFN